MTDSMEMTILSILAPALHCECNISCYQQALFTTVSFFYLNVYFIPFYFMYNSDIVHSMIISVVNMYYKILLFYITLFLKWIIFS